MTTIAMSGFRSNRDKDTKEKKKGQFTRGPIIIALPLQCTMYIPVIVFHICWIICFFA